MTDRSRSAASLAIGRPTVSVITPSFNQARYLGETLRSVAGQTYPHIEHIVMDGGSTDGSVDLIERWSREHPVVWQSKPDGGQAAAIAEGLMAATGDIVAWLNSDDIYLDDQAISAVVDVFESGAQAVTGAGWYVTETGTRMNRIPLYPTRLRFDSLRHVDWILQPATFMRRTVLERVPIDTSLVYAFDWDLFIRISREIDFTPIPRDIAGYRIHPSGKTVSGSGSRKRELLEVTKRYNGAYSAHSLLLNALVTGYDLVEPLPRLPRRTLRRGLSAIALLSQQLPGGKGVQF